MVWALILAIALASPAYAEDIEVVSEPEKIEVVPEQVGSTDPTVVESLEKDAKEEKATEQTTDDGAEQGEEAPTAEKVEEGSKEQTVESDTTKVEEYGEPLPQTRATVSLSAWSNMSPTNTYAVYARGLLKEVRQDESYCLLQDSSGSYTFVVGKADSLQSFTDARWWRWYNTSGVGWRLERGSGSASVSAGVYQVISNLEGYPSLDGEDSHMQRREVLFYALVAISVFSLASVWTFCIRMSRGGYS